MESKEMLGIKEEHVTTVFGVAIIRKYIYIVSDAENRKPSINPRLATRCRPTATSDEQEGPKKPAEIFKRANTVSILIVSLAVFLLFNPPQVVDNLINVVMRSCPEKLELHKVQERLDGCATSMKITSESLTICSDETLKRDNDLKICSNEKEASGKKLNEARNTTSSLENSLAEGERNIERLERSENDLQINVASLTEEKGNLRQKVDDTEVMLGNCRNKNMDHEIEKSQILRKLEKAERELKSCH